VGVFGRLRREYSELSGIVRTLRRVDRIKPDSPWTAADMIERWARETPDAAAIFFENRSYSFRQYDQAGNQYARWAQAQGIARGETVALLMENRPEFLFAWLGIVKIGAVAALINSNLRGEPLAHSLRISDAKHLILGAELAPSYASAKALVGRPMTVWATGASVEGTVDLDVELSCLSPEPVDPALRDGMTAANKCFYIYTSGTTGLPKAANISHLRFFVLANGFSAITRATRRDRMYVALPLYHSSGGICAIGCTLTVGGAIILTRKFSASRFWDECEAHGATLFEYIGELCRYLLNAPTHPLEKQHKLRLIIGNGLRPEIWARFQERFAIPHIVEFYGSTEGNVQIVNFDGMPGSVGRVPRYLERLFGVKLVKFDIEAQEVVRNTKGFCIECAPGEVGELLGRIATDPEAARGRFEGYADASETETKILRDVLVKGDAWFRTSDLLKKDEAGYYYFVDRAGDTFRWKGENVSTNEVAQVLAAFPGVKEANVYGVRVPGADGRAGMAALVVEETIDLNGLHKHLERELPAYARPLFLRVQSEISATSTFKQRKLELVDEGFDPRRVKEPLFFDHPKLHGYVPLTEQILRDIEAGEVRL